MKIVRQCILYGHTPKKDNNPFCKPLSLKGAEKRLVEKRSYSQRCRTCVCLGQPRDEKHILRHLPIILHDRIHFYPTPFFGKMSLRCCELPSFRDIVQPQKQVEFDVSSMRLDFQRISSIQTVQSVVHRDIKLLMIEFVP